MRIASSSDQICSKIIRLEFSGRRCWPLLPGQPDSSPPQPRREVLPPGETVHVPGQNREASLIALFTSNRLPGASAEFEHEPRLRDGIRSIGSDPEPASPKFCQWRPLEQKPEFQAKLQRELTFSGMVGTVMPFAAGRGVPGRGARGGGRVHRVNGDRLQPSILGIELDVQLSNNPTAEDWNLSAGNRRTDVCEAVPRVMSVAETQPLCPFHVAVLIPRTWIDQKEHIAGFLHLEIEWGLDLMLRRTFTKAGVVEEIDQSLRGGDLGLGDRRSISPTGARITGAALPRASQIVSE
jgi:hypothetical protein